MLMNNDFPEFFEFELPKGELGGVFDDIYSLVQSIQETIKANYDPRKKEIGDRVVAWDGSSLTKMNGDEIFLNEDPFLTAEYFIVTDTHQDVYLTHTMEEVFEIDESGNQYEVERPDPDDEDYDEEDDEFEISYNQDLVIAHPETKETFRISSEHVKIIEL